MLNGDGDGDGAEVVVEQVTDLTCLTAGSNSWVLWSEMQMYSTPINYSTNLG